MNPNALALTVYSKPGCQPCKATKRWLDQHKIRYRDIDITESPEAAEVVRAMGYSGVPVVVVPFDDPNLPGHHWYGFNPDELEKLID